MSSSRTARHRSFVLVVIALMSLPAFAAAPSTQPTQSKLLEATPYQDEKSGLRINLPKGWVPKKDTNEVGFEAPVRDELNGKSLAANVLLIVIDAKGVKPSDLAELLKGERENDKKLFPEFKEIQSPPPAKKIPGKAVGVLEYTAKPDPNVMIHGRQIHIIGKDKIYVIGWTTLDDTYPKYQKLIDAVMNTLVVP